MKSLAILAAVILPVASITTTLYYSRRNRETAASQLLTLALCLAWLLSHIYVLYMLHGNVSNVILIPAAIIALGVWICGAILSGGLYENGVE